MGTEAKEQEVSQLFSDLRKMTEGDRTKITSELVNMLNKNSQYFDILIQRLFRCLSQSNDMDDKRAALLAISCLPDVLEDYQKTSLVNKFHSPIFKLMEGNTDQAFLDRAALAYEKIISLGGNKNDSAVDDNLNAALNWINLSNSKDIKKATALIIIRILLVESPYTTFKKLFQKDNSSSTSDKQNYSLLTKVSTNKNIKIRVQYLKFFEEFVRHIAQRRDANFQHNYFKRFYSELMTNRDSKEEEIVHLILEGVRILLIHAENIFSQDTYNEIVTYIIQKKNGNKNPVVQKSLISIIPVVSIAPRYQMLSPKKQDKYFDFLTYLRSIVGEDKVDAYRSIYEMIQNARSSDIDAPLIAQLKSIVHSIRNHLRERTEKLNLLTRKETVIIKCMLCILTKLKKEKTEANFTRQEIDEIVTSVLLQGLYEQSVRFVLEVSRQDIHGLADLVEKKLIAIVSKILAGDSRRMPHNDVEIETFVKVHIQKISGSQQFRSQENRIDAIRSLSVYKFKEKNMPVVCGLVLQKIMKNYLQWRIGDTRKAAVEAAFLLYAKKQRRSIQRQMTQIMGRILNVGMSDPDEQVKKTVFNCLRKNLSSQQGLHKYLNVDTHFLKLFQCLKDRNIYIQKITLEILCSLCENNPSDIVPFLKKVLYQFLISLKRLDQSNLNEKNNILKLLRCMIKYGTNIIEAHAPFICRIMIMYLSDKQHAQILSQFIFKTFKRLTEYLPFSTRPYIDLMAQYQLQAMQDKLNSKKRRIAVKSFISVIRNCGYVILPYCKFPNLLPTIVYLVKGGIDQEGRLDLLKILGGLGAIDRFRYKVLRKIYDQQGNAGVEAFLEENKVHCYYLQNEKEAREEEAKDKTVNELKLLEQDLIVLINSKKPVRMYPALTTNPQYFIPKDEGKEQSIPSRDINELTINCLLRILEDPSLNKKHPLTIEALSKIIDILGTSLEKYMKSIISRLLKLSSENLNVMRVVYAIAQNCDLGQYTEQVLKYVINNASNSQLTSVCLDILELFSTRFKSYLRHSLQHIINMSTKLIRAGVPDETVIKMFNVFRNLEQLLDPHIHILIPFLCQNFLKSSSILTNNFLELLVSFAQKCSSTIEYLSLITQYLVDLLNNLPKLTAFSRQDDKQKLTVSITRSKAINTVVAFVLIFKQSFKVYLPLAHKAIQAGPENRLYSKCIRYIQNRSNLEQISEYFSQQEQMYILGESKLSAPLKQEAPRINKKPEGLENLINEFDPSQKNQIDQDWNEWLRKTSLELLKKSPSPVLKACTSLAEQYLQLAGELYNVAFLQIWLMMQGDQRHKLTYHIKRVLNNNPPPPLNVRQTILNLTQFMGRHNHFSQLEPEFLAKASKDALAYAKTLYFCEQLFELNPQRQMETLIQIYTLLGQPQSAAGLLKIAQKHRIETKVSWHEKLQRYEQAIEEYNRLGDRTQDTMISKIKCFNEMGDWKLVLDSCTKISNDKQKQVADLAVHATINMGQWELAKQWIKSVDTSNENYSFWNAILSIKKEDYDEAEKQIRVNRNLIYNQISQLLTFSSNHSADSLIRLQQLFELQEIIDIKRLQKSIVEKGHENRNNISQLHRKIDNLKQVWSDRLRGNTKSLIVWQKILCVRNLMFSKADYVDFWLEYCKLALKQHKNDICKATLDSIKSELASRNQNQKIVEIELLELQHRFRSGIIKEDDAIKKVQHFLEKNTDIDNKMKAKMYYKCAGWIREREDEEVTSDRTQQILDLVSKSTLLNPKAIKGWHFLGVMYSEMLQNSKLDDSKNIKTDGDIRNALQSLKAFFKSLQLGTSKHKYFLQDCLKLMTLVFQYNQDKRIAEEFITSFRRVAPEGWIEVIPQIIARLYTKNKRSSNLSSLLRELLLYIGEQHPQALIYPLIFAAKSKTKDRREPALAILKRIQERDYEICSQAELISTELGKAAIKLKEYWFDGIEGAWKIYDETKNIAETVKTLKQVHEFQKEREIKSNSQLSFEQQFGLELNQAYQWLLKFQKTNEPICFAQAFEIYYTVYKRIKESFEGLKKIYLKNVAPVLLSINDCKLSMPGLYQPGKPIVRIQGFQNQLVVLQSKQRPRKLIIYGSDGKEYVFLLKGRQDLRLDERVMQLLSLVNKLLQLNQNTLKKDLFVTRYSIIPLSVNTGLIGWVEDCDTLNQLIKEYRSDHKIRPDVEKTLYEKFCDEYSQLPMINKVEIFRHVLESTQGLDLAKVLWLKSANSEAWIQRRTCYTRSLATMSMVGYILGLGDRHPSNIMIQRKTGKIVHIDFGDCFQVAMLRDKFPQRVPFRLTRMLQKAMEVCGIEGNYKSTCQTVMNVLRSNKESLLIVLEAFLYDPIISWKLNTHHVPKPQNNGIVQQKQQDHPFPQDKQDNNQIISNIMEQFSNRQFKDKAEAEDDKKPQATPGRIFKLDNQPPEYINEKAKYALSRIKKKLYGRDFDDSKILNVVEQVERLIREAKSYENICQSWIGWCPFW